MKNYFILLLIGVFLTGCSSTYRPDGYSGGYSEVKLDENVYRVTFRGNGYTDSQKAADLALLRCAELTVEKGFPYFVILKGEDRESRGSYVTPSQTYTSGNVNRYGFYSNSTSYGGNTVNFVKPSTTNTIAMLAEKPTEGFAYNAKTVFEGLTAKYNIQTP